jgi:DNA-binding response OmpR family regulator
MRVLLVSDDPDRANRVIALLEREDHEVTHARTHDGGEFDLIILDGPDTLETCAAIRAARAAQPILVLTPDEDPAARVEALRAGADDALGTPFAASQMIARVDALARRARLVPADPRMLEADGCRIDLDHLRATRASTSKPLTAREASILAWLHRHRGRAVSRAELLAAVWGVAPTMATRTVDQTISVLRKKIERDPSRPRIVVGVKAVGYAWGDRSFTQP